MIADFIKIHGLGKIQDLLTLEMELTQAGYTMDDLEAFVETKRRLLKKKERILAMPVRRCACGGELVLLPVNTGAGDRTGDDATGVWFCPACLHEEWIHQSLHTIVGRAFDAQADRPRKSRPRKSRRKRKVQP